MSALLKIDTSDNTLLQAPPNKLVKVNSDVRLGILIGTKDHCHASHEINND